MDWRIGVIAVLLGFGSGLVGCGCGSGSDPGADSGGDGGVLDEPEPFRDDWETVIDAAFPYLDPETGAAVITELRVGGNEFNDNFANRGDVIVRFTGEPALPEGRIVVEFRRFTSARSEARAQEDFAKLLPWASNDGIDTPVPATDIDPNDDCSARWREGCAVRVWFDGQVQLQRAGVDIRVTLPENYRHRVDVVTQDNDIDDFYLNRGNVCVEGLPGSMRADLESGTAWVSLAPDIAPVPWCSDEQVAACDGYELDGAPAPWHATCPCLTASEGAYGQAGVFSDNADVWIDVPPALWTAVSARNNMARDCTAGVFIPGFVEEDDTDGLVHDTRGTANRPGDSATAGAGYSISVVSDVCGPVQFTEDPDEFLGRGHGAEQTSELRGNVEICSGCQTPLGPLSDVPCEDLIGG